MTGTTYRGKNVLVLGLARSGTAALKLLLQEGALVSGADEDERIAVPPDLNGIPINRGPFTIDLLDRCDEVIVSPGISTSHSIVQEALNRGIPVLSEIELGSRFTESTIIAVTGTNGKSTTANMIGEILKAGGCDMRVAGNVGLPFCSIVRELDSRGFFVLEISSFQLEAVSSFHPTVAGILNLTPDHLDRYRTEDDYYRAKMRIMENCGEDDAFFYNAEDARCVAVANHFAGKCIPFSSRRAVAGGVYCEGDKMVRLRDGHREVFLEVGELSVVGLHNIENALAAVASLQFLDIPREACRKALTGFKGLPHRMEKVATMGGVTYYNDSKATNVEGTLMSLKGLQRPVVLIAGGRDKGGDFSKLRTVLDRIRTVVTLGEAAVQISEAMGPEISTTRASSMEEAVTIAAHAAKRGDIVLLSPACASFDMFTDFEHRGEVFKGCVRALEKAKQ